MYSLNGKYIDIFYSYSFLLVSLVSFMILYLIFSFFNAFFFYGDCLDASKLEYYWTLVPGLILFIFSIPSLTSLYYQDKIGFYGFDNSVSVLGSQWFWEYFDYFLDYNSVLSPSGDVMLRNLSVSDPLLISSNKVCRVLCSSKDVIHSFSVPEFGLKLDCVNGRYNVGYFLPLFNGNYYGQCSEVCGVNHSYMPISVTVYSKEVYNNVMVTQFNVVDRFMEVVYLSIV
uniref:Cytochrome c oxidase subunit 2 n=1 Tax=Dugesia japonica TaxID=6161 RepID=G9M8V7_DUGJA|nr:cytochrome c oxidase subunit II [Dugesia japonica]